MLCDTKSPEITSYRNRLVACLTGVYHRDKVIRAIAPNIARSVDGVPPGRHWIPVVMGFHFGCEEIVTECLRTEREFWFVDHAYFNRGYETGNFRLIRNAVHQAKILPLPSRWNREVVGWRSGGSDVIVIYPSKNIQRVLEQPNWKERVCDELPRYTNRKIIVKRKGDGELKPLLKNAHAVVSLASVAEVEAAAFGVPVFVSEWSPCASISAGTLAEIETPRKPDRTAWLASLSNAQWSVEEMSKGKPFEVLSGYFDLR